MTAADWVTVIGALGGFVTVLGGVIVMIIKTWKDEIKSDMKVIQNSVDGTASKQEAKLDAALTQLKSVTEQLSKEEQKAALLAAGRAAPAAERGDGNHLKKIEKNTASIEKDTAEKPKRRE